MNLAQPPFSQMRIDQGMPLRGPDELAGLLSRNLFACTLDRELARVWPRASALLLIGPDGLQAIGDTFDQAAVDNVLRQFALRLFELAPPRATLGRVDDHTFALLLAAPEDLHQVTRVAAQIRRALEAPFDAGPAQVGVTACIGIATCSVDADSGAELLAHAATALQEARACGPGVCSFYTAAVPPRPHQRRAFEQA